MPAIIPVTIPVDDPMVALPLLLVHVPPAGVEFNVVVRPTHTLATPVMVVGLGFTVTVVVIKHPVASEYVMTDVPGITPVTIPVDDPMVALPLLLLHVPPAGVEFKVVVKPTHTFLVPVIVDGVVFTVTTIVLIQPVEII